MQEGLITIKLNGVSFEETERCRQIIHKLFESNVFVLRNGKAILNFDNFGGLADIEVSMKTYSRRYENEPPIVLNPMNQFKIENTRDNSTIAKRI